MSQRPAGSEEVELVLAKGAPQSCHELSTKHLAQDFHRQEEMMRRADPASMLRRQSAAGHHAVHAVAARSVKGRDGGSGVARVENRRGRKLDQFEVEYSTQLKNASTQPSN